MIGRIHNTRTWIVFTLFLCFSAAILFRLFTIQCLQHPEYTLRARGQHKKTEYIVPRRGTIYDRNGDILAVSIPCFSVYASPREFDQASRRAAVNALSPLLGMDNDSLEKKLEGRRWFVWLERHLPDKKAEAIRRLDLKGIYLKEEMKRVYPKETLLSQVLGFTDPDGNGLEGVEWKYDRQLKGHPGWLLTEKDSRQREATWFRSGSVEAIDGCNLFLTIDDVIQDIAEEELDKVFREYKAKWACMVVMDPATGDILALANRPTYDPNSYNLARPASRRNRALTDPIEPGSTFKVFPAAAALDKGVVRAESEFFCENGAYRMGGAVLHDHRPHGILTFSEIIKKSSNIGMAKVGMLLGEEELYEYLKKFGIGEKTRIALSGEAPGLLRKLSDWSSLSLRSITMGHEVSVTSIGLLTAFSALGNDGVLLKPRIVDRIESPGGEVIYRSERRRRDRAVSPETARTMMAILRGVVEEEGGTGGRAAVPGLEVAGKTGTAQKLSPEGGYSHSDYRALFMGMLPASEPRLAILVVVDEPRPLYYGGVVAAPAFRLAAERISRYLNIRPAGGSAVERELETASSERCREKES